MKMNIFIYVGKPTRELKLNLNHFKDVTLKEGLEKLGKYDKSYGFYFKEE